VSSDEDLYMTGNSEDDRRQRIEAAAFEVLSERGYRSTSMLQIAKKASASNETLYRWYGSKQALFQSIIEANGEAARQFLLHRLEQHDDALETLQAVGPLLLQYIADKKAIIMMRAAVSDASETGVLGKAIDDCGRTAVFQLICSLMQRLADEGRFTLDDDAEGAADVYVSLLFGELQIRQALGNVGPLSKKQAKRRADKAFALVCRLYS